MKKNLITKTIIRTLIYQYLGLLVGLSIGFICAPNYWGVRVPVFERSIRNIFYPIEFNNQVEDFLIDVGRGRLWSELDDPKNLKFYNSEIIGQEWFETDYSYTNSDGVSIEDHYRTRINWKPWEQYYPLTNENQGDFNE